MTNSGNSIASFLLGQVDTFQIDLQQSKIRPRDHIEEYFAQDDWKLTGRLTLNIGARYTLHFPSTEKNNQGAVFNLSTPAARLSRQERTTRAALANCITTTLRPASGFAFCSLPRTVVRSGFGIVFIDQSGITTPFTTPQFPFIQNVQQRTQDNLRPHSSLSQGPVRSSDSAYARRRPRAERLYRRSTVRVLAMSSSGTSPCSARSQQTRQSRSHMSARTSFTSAYPIPISTSSPRRRLAEGPTLLKTVPNPYYGQIPASSSHRRQNHYHGRNS